MRVSDRTRVRRRAQRGRYEREVVEAILDQGLICHVGFVAEHGPVVLPTTYVRVGDTLYLHGAPANAMLRAGSADACVTVTLIDALVLARSAFHHSMNYRSAVVFGRFREVTDEGEKRAAMTALVDHVVPGRSAEARPPSAEELRSTLVVALALDEASAKVRTGPPIDDDADMDLPVWAGELPLIVGVGEPVPDPALADGIPAPPSVTTFGRTLHP